MHYRKLFFDYDSYASVDYPFTSSDDDFLEKYFTIAYPMYYGHAYDEKVPRPPRRIPEAYAQVLRQFPGWKWGDYDSRRKKYLPKSDIAGTSLRSGFLIYSTRAKSVLSKFLDCYGAWIDISQDVDERHLLLPTVPYGTYEPTEDCPHFVSTYNKGEYISEEFHKAYKENHLTGLRFSDPYEFVDGKFVLLPSPTKRQPPRKTTLGEVITACIDGKMDAADLADIAFDAIQDSFDERYFEEFARLPKEIQLIWAVRMYEMWFGDAGFSGPLFDFTRYLPFAEEGYRAIGLQNAADLVAKQIKALQKAHIGLEEDLYALRKKEDERYTKLENFLANEYPEVGFDSSVPYEDIECADARGRYICAHAEVFASLPVEVEASFGRE